MTLDTCGRGVCVLAGLRQARQSAEPPGVLLLEALPIHGPSSGRTAGASLLLHMVKLARSARAAVNWDYGAMDSS